MTFLSATARSAACSGVVTGVPPAWASARIAAGVGMVAMRAEGVDMIEVSVRTRPGCPMARACAIIPPREAPTT